MYWIVSGSGWKIMIYCLTTTMKHQNVIQYAKTASLLSNSFGCMHILVSPQPMWSYCTKILTMVYFKLEIENIL